MNKNISFVVIATLATALALTPIGSAYAANVAYVEDGRKQLSPKSFGEKNKHVVCGDQPCFDKVNKITKDNKSAKEKWADMQKSKALAKYAKPIRN